MKFWIRNMALFTALLLTVASCSTQRSGVTYTSDQARSVQQVAYGTVTGVREVTIQDQETGLGVAGGGIAGGVAGSTIGGGQGTKLATLGGALVGAAIGHMAEKKMSTDAALEIEIKLDSGGLISVVQTADVPFEVGERIRVLTAADGTIRVTKF